jgi:hypothetical protein
MAPPPQQRKGKEDPRQSLRYAIRVPITCRPDDGPVWHDGVTENISGEGILFRTDFAIELETRIEMNFVLPGRNAQISAEVHCRGEIVRCEQIGETGAGVAVAARIRHYHMRRPDVPPKQHSGSETRGAEQDCSAAD